MDGNGTSTNDVRPKSFPHLIFVAGMVLPAAFLYLVVSSQYHVFIFVLLGLSFSAFYRKTIPYSDRSVIYSALLALVLAALMDTVFPLRRDRMMLGRLFAANISVPFVLYLAVLSTFFEQSPYTLGFAAATSLMAMMMGGDFRPFYGEPGSDIGSPPMFAFFLENFHAFFACVALVEVLALITAFNHARGTACHRRVGGVGLTKKIVFGSALILAAGVCVGALFLVSVYRTEIRSLENYLGRLRFRSAPPSQKVFFGKNIDLNASIRANRSENRDLVLLRAKGASPPGYLRGRIYQYYCDGHWSVSLRSTLKEARREVNLEGLALNAFHLPGKRGRGQSGNASDGRGGTSVDIYPTSSCLANFLFLPGDIRKVEIVADRLRYSEDGFFSPKDWESDGGYTVWMDSSHPGAAAYPLPSSPSPLFYLGTPKELEPLLDRALLDIFGCSPTGANARRFTDTEKTARVVDFFRTRFTYTLKPEIPPRGEDPLISFLSKTRAGHCELFATSAVLLLRRMGVRTRYVAGLLCREAHPSGGYYVARLRDAHAWLEAYSSEEGRWILVDPTPPADGPLAGGGGTWGFWNAWVDRLKQAFAEAFAAARRGYVARAIVSLVVGLASIVWDVLGTLPGTLAALAVFAFLFFSRWRRRRGESSSNAHLHISKEMSLLRREILKLEKIVSKIAGVRRGESETMLEWLSALGEAGFNPAVLEDLEKMVEEYNVLRFSRASSDGPETTALLLELKRFRSTVR
jgi:hypothetical protein